MSKVLSNSAAGNSKKFSIEARGKAVAQRVQYFTVGKYLHSSMLLLAGPDYFRPVRNALRYITTRKQTPNGYVLLLDTDSRLKAGLLEKWNLHRKENPEEANRVRMRIGSGEGDVLNAKPERFEDLDFLESWNGSLGQTDRSPGEIFLERITLQAKTWPNIRFRKGISFTVCLRNISDGKKTIVNGINTLLSVLGTGIEDLYVPEFNFGSTWGWDKTSPISDSPAVYSHTPIFPSRDRGRLLKLQVLTYKDGSPMVTGIIIYS